MFVNAYDGVHSNSRLGDWYTDVDMFRGLKGSFNKEVFESLMAFYPGSFLGSFLKDFILEDGALIMVVEGTR
eukprot:7360068-Ditylum_brightwellii.AAC.1